MVDRACDQIKIWKVKSMADLTLFHISTDHYREFCTLLTDNVS